MIGHPDWYVFYNVLIWIIAFIITYRSFLNNSVTGNDVSSKFKNSNIILWSLLIAYSLFTFFGGDAARYEEFVTNGYKYYDSELVHEHEYLYVYLAKLVGGNFILWKLLVYGCAYAIVKASIKRFNCDNYITMLAFVIFALYSYGATRAVLAYAIFLYAISFVDLDNKKFLPIVIALLVASISAHSSMLLVVILSPLCFVKLNKKVLLILAALFPILIGVMNSSFAMILANTGLMGFSGQKVEVYSEADFGAEGYNAGILITTRLYMQYALILVTLYLYLKAEMRKLLPQKVMYLGRICFFLTYVALLINFSEIPSKTVLFTRYITMVNFFIFILWSYLLPQRTLFNGSNPKLYYKFAILVAFMVLFNTVYYELNL